VKVYTDQDEIAFRINPHCGTHKRTVFMLGPKGPGIDRFREPVVVKPIGSLAFCLEIQAFAGFLVKHRHFSPADNLTDQEDDLKGDYGRYERVDDTLKALPTPALTHDTPLSATDVVEKFWILGAHTTDQRRDGDP
jgi:hypothetical protein